MTRESRQKPEGNERSPAEVAVKTARAEVEAAAQRLAEAKALLVASQQRMHKIAAGGDREAVREAVLARQVEEELVAGAESAFANAEAKLAELEAEADRLRRQAASDRARQRIDEAEAAFTDKYAPAMATLLDALSIAAAAERAAAEANALLPEGAEPFTPPFGFGGAAPKFIRIVALDGRGSELWSGDQFARPRA